MPKVMQDQFKNPGSSRSFSTSTRSRTPDVEGISNDDASSAALLANMIQQVNEQAVERDPGLKFEAPPSPAKTLNFRKRYDSLQEQFTNMLMKEGKLARAQRVCTALHLSSTGANRRCCIEHVYHPGSPPHLIRSQPEPPPPATRRSSGISAAF